MKSTLLLGICAASFFVTGAPQASGTWERHTAPFGPQRVTVGYEEKTVNPSCALGQPYSFSIKPGKNDKLLVFFNGGGACWDNNTCIGSLTTSRPVYNPSTGTSNDPTLMGGILDINNPANPYSAWSMAFISYCTGDVHTGSADFTYSNPVPPGPANPFPAQFTIHHRGFDNFLFVMDWLKDNYPEIDPKKILIAGSSAGAYGATLNLPWLKEFFPDAEKIFLVSDGGVGVIDESIFMNSNTSGFVNAVFGTPSNWNIDETLHPVLTSLPAEVLAQPENLVPEAYRQLAATYPKFKFAHYTTYFDAIQIFFWDIMLHPNSPLLWGLGLSQPLFISEWNGEMRAITAGLSSDLPLNYRHYIGSGCNHTIFRYNDDFYNSTLVSSGGGQIGFRDWLKAMTGENNADKTKWQNLSCETGSDCGLSTPANDIQNCVARTFNAP